MFSKGSLHIATVAGIPVKLHWTFALLVGLVTYTSFSSGYGWLGSLYFGLFILTLFFCVVLHELGHALAARYYNVPTQDIILSPIGGVARLKHLPEKAFHELIIAIAGPMVNVIIAFVLFGVLWFKQQSPLEISGDGFEAFMSFYNFMPLIFFMNIFLVAFNMIPAFPMDGGRVLRALLAMRLGKLKATLIATRIGQLLAIGFVGLGIYMGHLVLPFIGVFIFLVAGSEYKSVRFQESIRGRRVLDIYRDQYSLLFEYAPVRQAIDRMNRSMERDFLVTNQLGHVSGVLREEAIKEAIRQNDTDAVIAGYKSQNYEAIDVSYPLEYIIQLFQKKDYSILPVYQNGEFVGVIDRHSFGSIM
jgi:Zn-dependent protease